MASTILERKNINYALHLKREKKFPSVVVGAEYSYFKKVCRSGPISPNLIVDSLRNKLLRIGDLYSEVNGNSIGCCAEVNSANKILILRPFVPLKAISFSKPIRPRTMQEVPVCKNCKLTFR
nr:hypothetical protein [uncultured Flavobacterium sp.]